MEFATLGRNHMSRCDCCDELFVVKGYDNFAEAIDQITELAKLHRSQSPACEKWFSELPSFWQIIESLRGGMQEADDARDDEAKSNPNNGTLGYWRVSGIRREATTRADSAPNAIAKCISAGAVGDWECATAEFIGVELPEVF